MKKARIDKEGKGDRRIARVMHTPSAAHSSLFGASFSNGALECEVMADQGADANFISEHLASSVEHEMGNTLWTHLNPAQIYRGVTGESCLTCNGQLKLDIFLRVRHGSILIIRNIEWKVTKENIHIPMIGRRVLESLGSDNSEMLMAARDNYEEDVDVTVRLTKDGNEYNCSGNIAALFAESIFHTGGNVDNDGLEYEDVYVDLDDDPPGSIRNEVS